MTNNDAHDALNKGAAAIILALAATIHILVIGGALYFVLNFNPALLLLAGVSPWALSFLSVLKDLLPSRSHSPVEREEADQIRLIPVNRPLRSDTFDPRDMAQFVKRIFATQDWTVRTWRSKRMPSGRIMDDEYLKLLCDSLSRAQVIENRGPRQSGYLVGSAESALAKLGL